MSDDPKSQPSRHYTVKNEYQINTNKIRLLRRHSRRLPDPFRKQFYIFTLIFFSPNRKVIGLIYERM